MRCYDSLLHMSLWKGRINEFQIRCRQQILSFSLFFSENKKYLVLPVDHLARRSIKIAAKRDSWCELQIF